MPFTPDSLRAPVVTHYLKIHQQPYDDLTQGVKTCEVRRCDDRDFNVGDLVELHVVYADGSDARPSKSVIREITHIQKGYGLPEGLCVLSYAPITTNAVREIATITKERDALRNTLVALAPDLKVMAILYQQQGQSQRAQALMAIRESLGLGE